MRPYASRPLAQCAPHRHPPRPWKPWQGPLLQPMSSQQPSTVRQPALFFPGPKPNSVAYGRPVALIGRGHICPAGPVQNQTGWPAIRPGALSEGPPSAQTSGHLWNCAKERALRVALAGLSLDQANEGPSRGRACASGKSWGYLAVSDDPDIRGVRRFAHPRCQAIRSSSTLAEQRSPAPAPYGVTGNW